MAYSVNYNDSQKPILLLIASNIIEDARRRFAPMTPAVTDDCSDLQMNTVHVLSELAIA